MENCKVTFEQDGQKIIADFILNDDSTLKYKVDMEPREFDPKKDYGLCGRLFAMFMDKLVEMTTDNNDSEEIAEVVPDEPSYCINTDSKTNE